MTHWKLILAYDGTPFHGWQVQPGLATVQGLLSDAIHRAIGERVLPQGSGRTDTGVHALAQVASFPLQAPIPADRLQIALNRCLPAAIRILSAQTVAPDFHARYSALRKTYEYRIFPSRAPIQAEAHGPDGQPDEWETNICPPTLAPFVWPCPWPISLDRLNRAADHVLGTHDFTSFAASDPDLAARAPAQPEGAGSPAKGPVLPAQIPGDPVPADQDQLRSGEAGPKSAVRTITQSAWHAEGGLLIYRVTATGFLHHMVRNLVGTFVQCGANRLSPQSIPQIMAARSRSAAGPTAPATGLFLLSVEYPAASPSTL